MSGSHGKGPVGRFAGPSARSPPVSLSQIDYMCDVMPAVPMICREQAVERHGSVLGVNERSRIIIRRKRTKKSNPAVVQHVEHGERRLDWRDTTVLERRPR